jgi:hypothetical protein
MSDDLVKAPITTGKVAGGLIPKDFDEMYRMANWMSKSGMMPKGCDRPEQVMVAMQMGLEVGLSPTQAVQNIAVINGKPSIYGDAAIGLVRGSGLISKHRETPITDANGNVIGFECYSKRTDGSEMTHRFTMDDAKRAGLLGKSGPWKDYPSRMLQMRARSWVIRDLYADVLKGLHMVEEVRDFVEAESVETLKADGPVESLKARLSAVDAAPEEQDSEVGEVPFGGDSEVIDAEVVETEPEPEAPTLREEVVSAAEKVTAMTDNFEVGNILVKNELPKISEMNGGQLKKALRVLTETIAELE